MRKSGQLQIRVTSAEKARLSWLARAAGQDVSAYVLSRALPSAGLRFESALRALREEADRKFAMADLSDALAELSTGELAEAVENASLDGLSEFAKNYAAALVEQACAKRGVRPPAWAGEVVPLEQPWFATSLRSLRVHQLQSSPAVFKRRNLFIDPGDGGRV